MVCEYCASGTRVINSRLQKRQNKVWRRRECESCGAVFTTIEASELSGSWLFVNNKHQEPFHKDKLLISVYESLKHRKTASIDSMQLTDTIISRLRNLISNGTIDSTTVRETAYLCLSRFDKTAGTLYQAFHKDDH